MCPALNPTPATPEWLTINEAAAGLGLDPKTIRRYIASGRLRAVRVGPRLLRIDAASVSAMTRAVGHFPAIQARRVTMRDAAFEDLKAVILTAAITFHQHATDPAGRAEALVVYRAKAVEAALDLDAALSAIDADGGSR